MRFCSVLLHQFNNDLLECTVFRVHDVVYRHALLSRIIVIVLCDVSVTATDSDHALVTSDHHFLHLAANQVAVFFRELDNGHESSEQLTETLEAELAEEIHQLGRRIILPFLLSVELAVDHCLGLLDLFQQLVDEDTAVAVTLLTLLHLLDLEVREPV